VRDGLDAGTVYEVDEFTFTTLPYLGERLATFATVNDVHFGEEVCGLMEGIEGEVFRSEPGEDAYPEVMNRAAIADMQAIDPDAVIVKGDLTRDGTDEEYEAFRAAYVTAFGDTLTHVRGNHDAYHGQDYASEPTQLVELPGVRLVVLDTTRPLHTPGRLVDEQLEWLDDMASDADVPVLVFGHHHPWDPGSDTRPDDYFGINPDDSERFIEVVARHDNIRGYFAGHTHRNRVRRFAATGDVPYVEVACVKDFPGSWAEYRVYEGGVLQIHRRISGPDALAWTEKTRGMFGGVYPHYSFGELDDRCFAIPANP
jgi:3',5'-cyclic AMP phosphodiesterase CpdA